MLKDMPEGSKNVRLRAVDALRRPNRNESSDNSIGGLLIRFVF